MRLGPVAALVLLLAFLPVASAQAPAPEEVVALACGTLGAAAPPARPLLPLCPRDEPAPQPETEPQPEPQTQPAPAPERAEELLAEVVEDARRAAEEPAEAPERLASIVATVVRFAKDALGLPGDAMDALREKVSAVAAEAQAAVSEAQAAIAEAQAAAESVRQEAARLVENVKQMLSPPARARAAPSAPSARGGIAVDAETLLPELPALRARAAI